MYLIRDVFIEAYLSLVRLWRLIPIAPRCIWKGCNITNAAAAAKLLQSCLTPSDPIDGSPPGSPITGILQARTLEWGAIASSYNTTNAIPLMQRPWKSLKFVSSPDWLGSSPKSKGRDETCTCIFTLVSVTPKPVIYSLHVTNPRIKRGRIQLQTCFRNLAFDKNGLRANRIIWEVRKKCF